MKDAVYRILEHTWIYRLSQSLECESNSHMFYILLKEEGTRDALMNYLKSNGIWAIFHYLPLHLSQIGRSMGYREGDLPATESTSGRLLRLPFYFELKREEQAEIIGLIEKFFRGDKSS